MPRGSLLTQPQQCFNFLNDRRFDNKKGNMVAIQSLLKIFWWRKTFSFVFTQPTFCDSRWKCWQETSPNFANFAAFGWFMWGAGCHMGGADQDMKFANWLSGDRAGREEVEHKHQSIAHKTATSPLDNSPSFLYRSESLLIVKFSGRYIGGKRESQSHLKSTNWSNVKERLKKVLLILCWIDHLGFLF